jgi:hypothetical protein
LIHVQLGDAKGNKGPEWQWMPGMLQDLPPNNGGAHVGAYLSDARKK